MKITKRAVGTWASVAALCFALCAPPATAQAAARYSDSDGPSTEVCERTCDIAYYACMIFTSQSVCFRAWLLCDMACENGTMSLGATSCTPPGDDLGSSLLEAAPAGSCLSPA